MRRLDELRVGGGRHLGRAGLVLLLSVTLLAAAAVGAHRVGLIDSWVDAGPDRRSAPALPHLRLPAPRPAHPVLSRLGSAPAPQARRVRAVIADALADPSLGPHVGVAVEDLTHGKPVLRMGGQRPFVPASLTKLFTVAAALRVLRPDQRFETSVVRVPGTHRIVLVGGGDPLLARRAGGSGKSAVGYPPQASLTRLAARAAKAMRHLGVRRVELQLDASLFAGPAVSRHWLSTYVRDEVVSPISALWVDEGRVAPDDAARSSDPVRAAGRTFADLLSRHGIQVVGAIRQRPAPRRAVEIAAVRSAPLVEVIDEVLGLSDNEAAEVLLRQVALARGLPPTFAGGVQAVRRVLQALGLDLRGVRLYDGSGLAPDNAVPLAAVVDLLRAAASRRHPELRPLLVDLPVAGFSGTLGYRFTDRRATAGRGVVRAKTATLTGVHGLAGVVVDRGGTLLGFVAIADQVRRRDALDARDALDRLAAALSRCGCR